MTPQLQGLARHPSATIPEIWSAEDCSLTKHMFKDIVSLRLSVLQMSINTNAAIFPLNIAVVLRLLIQFLLLTNLRVIFSCGPVHSTTVLSEIESRQH